MKLINLTQGSKEWLDFRRQHIGGSDCPAIMGKDPYKTPLYVYNEKLGYEAPKTAAMQRGSDLEPEARAFFSQKYGVDWQPAVGVHEDYPWMSASLDGWDGFTVLEIKCLGEKRFREVQQKGKPFEEHMWQLQHELEVFEASAGILAYYFKSPSGLIETVEVASGMDRAMIDDLVAKERAFWHDCVLSWKAPEAAEADFLERLDDEWIKAEELAFDKYKEMKRLEKLFRAAEEEYDMAEGVLIKLAGDQSSRGDLFQVHYNPAKRCPIDYTKIPEVQALRTEYLDRFRAQPKPAYRVTRRRP